MEKQLRLIGQIRNNSNELVGYSVLHIETNQAKMMSLACTKKAIESMGCVNATIESDGRIEGTEASLTRLSIYNTQGEIVAQLRITILSAIVNRDEVIGYNLMDAWGRTAKCTVAETMILISKHGSTNAKIVDRQGKKIISAIYGEFEKVEAQTKKIEQVPEVKEKFTRATNEARYLGEYPSDSAMKNFDTNRYIYSKSIMKYYNGLNHVRQLKQAINNGRVLTFSELACNINIPEIQKVLKAVSAGKFGSRIERHYPKAMELLAKHSGNARVTADIILAFKKGVVGPPFKPHKGRDVIQYTDKYEYYPDADKKMMLYLDFVEAVILDCMNYARKNMTTKWSKKLIEIISGSAQARKYIEDKTGKAFDRETIIDAVRAASTNRIDGLSEVMFLAALEIVWVAMTSTETYGIYTMINRIAEENMAMPKQIEGTKDYGAMLGQALIIALALKR